MGHQENTNMQPTQKISYITEYVVVAGYVFFFCALIAACVGFTYLNRAQFMPAPTQVNEFALGLPALTPTAHVLTTSQFPADAVIFRDDFVSNDNGWLESDDDTYETFEDSRLFFSLQI